MSKKKKFSIETLEELKPGFSAVVSDIQSGRLTLVNKQPTQQDRLGVFKEEINGLRNLPYSTISALLKDHIGLCVSEQSLRTFCQVELGWPKKSSRCNSQETTTTAPINVAHNKEAISAGVPAEEKEIHND
ncbi:MAG: hypothetical protein V7739_20070 [Motiliproteus sp.]